MSTISPTTLVAIGSVLLVVVVLMALQKNISTIITALVMSLVLIYFIQQSTGTELVNFDNLGAFALEHILKFTHWVQTVFWPKLSEVAKDIGNRDHKIICVKVNRHLSFRQD